MEAKHGTDDLHHAPVLRSIPKQDPFVVPDGFFFAFPHEVQQRAVAKEKRLPKVLRDWRSSDLTKWSAGIAALLAIAAFLWWNTPQPNAPLVGEHPHWSEGDLFHADMDVELLYTEFFPDDELMEAVHLPEDNDAILAYLEDQDLPLDLLIDEL
ncbi:MAG TPA: hypothetical protein PL070_18395 [Flavobacteriales bacterium]|nr:hypothetical protein [Flavobacteriales bacterium]